MKPYGNKIIVEVLAPAMKTDSGIHFPESLLNSKQKRGTVIAVGNGVFQNGILVPISLSTGDIVLFNDFGAIEVEGGRGIKHLIVSEEDIIAVF